MSWPEDWERLSAAYDDMKHRAEQAEARLASYEARVEENERRVEHVIEHGVGEYVRGVLLGEVPIE